MKFAYIPLNQIEISDWNARKEKIEEGLSELAESIEEIGLQQPIVVYKKEDNKYEVIIGQRRTLACKKLGLTEIPALITEIQDDTELLIKSFSENIHRLDLKYRDKMRVAIVLLKKYNSITDIASHLGVSQSSVRKYLGYTGVPESIKRMVDDGKLSASTATRIWVNIPNEEQAIRIAEKIIETPRREDRNKLIDLLKAYPNKTAEEIVEMSKTLKYRTVTIDLTPPVSFALTKACEDTYSDPELIALEALESWLKTKGFLE